MFCWLRRALCLGCIGSSNRELLRAAQSPSAMPACAKKVVDRGLSSRAGLKACQQEPVPSVRVDCASHDFGRGRHVQFTELLDRPETSRSAACSKPQQLQQARESRTASDIFRPRKFVLLRACFQLMKPELDVLASWDMPFWGLLLPADLHQGLPCRLLALCYLGVVHETE